MVRPGTSHGGGTAIPSPTNRTGGHGSTDTDRPARRPHVHTATHNVSAAQQATFEVARAGRPGGRQGPGDSRPSQEPGRYAGPRRRDARALDDLVAQHGADSPGDWVHAINPNFATGRQEWTNNCGECARSFAQTYQGDAPRAAWGDTSPNPGEDHEMREWADNVVPDTREFTGTPSQQSLDTFSRQTYDEIGRELAQQPSGTVAIIGVDWARQLPSGQWVPNGGHWFNAYVDKNGDVMWVDAQNGTHRPWPPVYGRPIHRGDAVFRVDNRSGWQDLLPSQTGGTP
jgi:hypothetical protein